MVEFRALGPVEATVSGRPVDLGPPKQRALLALLVSQVGRPVSVDVILEVLWAGHPPPSAMTSLQAYVANLRRLLEPNRAPRAPATVLRTSLGSYLLDSNVVDVDVCRFNEYATAGRYAWNRDDPRRALTEFEAGLALWRGRAYPEVANAPCVVPEVARLEELRLSVFEMRCAALLAVGAHEVAVADLGAFMKVNPLREYGCELLSLALYRAGRQADALEALRIIQERLTDEMGLDPKPALRQRMRAILNQDPTLDWHPTPAVPAVVAPTRPVTASRATPDSGPEIFVGREATLRHLTEALVGVEAGQGRVVTVSGEPGVGKTSLLRRFADLTDVPVLCGSCPEHVAAPPLWPWEQVLRAAGTRFPQRSLPGPVAELVEGNTTRLLEGEDLTGAALLRFEAIVEYLTDVSRTAPLVVVLDHLHRADPSSLRLLAHLTESAQTSRLLLIVSYRSDEASALAETLAALARRELTRIELSGLNTQDTRTLAGAILDQEVSERTAEELRDRTEGNPFFLRELIKQLAGEPGSAGPRRAPVPAPVREVALQRVARLPRPAAEMLSVAAVAGRYFDIEVVAEIASIEIDAALELLDTAIEAGLVVEDQHTLGWFRFTHAVVAETLYETTGRLRRARLSRRLCVAASRARTGESGADGAWHEFLAQRKGPEPPGPWTGQPSATTQHRLEVASATNLNPSVD